MRRRQSRQVRCKTSGLWIPKTRLYRVFGTPRCSHQQLVLTRAGVFLVSRTMGLTAVDR